MPLCVGVSGRMTGTRVKRSKGGQLGRPQKLLPGCREGVRASAVVQVKGEGGGEGRRTETGKISNITEGEGRRILT